MYTKLAVSFLGAALIIIVECLINNRKASFGIAALYLAAVIYITIFSAGRSDSGLLGFKLSLPFCRAIANGKYGLSTNRSVLNILMFVPLGYLLPKLGFKAKEKCKPLFFKVTLVGFICSMLIETTQLIFRCGIFEVDDLIKNTMGAAIGCCVFCVIDCQKSSGESERSNDK